MKVYRMKGIQGKMNWYSYPEKLGKKLIPDLLHAFFKRALLREAPGQEKAEDGRKIRGRKTCPPGGGTLSQARLKEKV